MRILTASDRALLIEARDLDEAMRLNLAWDGVPGVVERIPGARTVLVRFDPLRTSASELAAVLAATEIGTGDLPSAGEVTVPVRYDGEDLDEAASLLGVSADELIRRHLAADWQVAFSGFAPGFGYVVSGDPLFDVPRRSSPRTRVPAGSVALAGAFTGVYPRESPGGWQLIGRTDAAMWDIDRDPPALLSPGALVRFTRAERDAIRAGSGSPSSAGGPNPRDDRSEAPTPSDDPRSSAVEVVRPSLQLLVNHDDAKREFAYAEKDGASLAAARAQGFTVVSIKRDWQSVFGVGTRLLGKGPATVPARKDAPRPSP